MSIYIGITIGPIYDNVSAARKTRELWGCSFIFSLLMEQIIDAANDSWVLLSPAIPESRLNGAGIYPDRCFFVLEEPFTDSEFTAMKNLAIHKLNGSLPGAKHLCSSHFRILMAQLDSNDLVDSKSTLVPEKTKASAILKLNRILDMMELQPHIDRAKESLVDWVEENIFALQKDGNFNSGFVQYDKYKNRLPSVHEIRFAEFKNTPSYNEKIESVTNNAVIEYQAEKLDGDSSDIKKLRVDQAKKEQEELARFLNLESENLKFRHNYVCYVKADGDNMGNLLGLIGNNQSQLKEFSRLLSAYMQKAVNQIADFGGLSIYAGGDDLFFVAPVQNALGQNVFDLIGNLNNAFIDINIMSILDDKGQNILISDQKIPSISFGVSIAYYKHPMGDAIEKCNDQLFGKAKTLEGKNALSFNVLKHSGRSFEATVGINSPGFNSMRNLISSSASQDVNELNSVMFKLIELSSLLSQSLCSGTEDYFFENHFNEGIHKESEVKDFISSVKATCKDFYSENEGDIAPTVFALLRLVQFLNQDMHE